MMKYGSVLVLSLSMALGVSAQAADQAQSRDQTKTPQQTQTQGNERVYGYDLMTEQERTDYQDRMRAAKTDQERETLRSEHHKQMQARAKAQGKALPEVPPAGRGQGADPGPFQGTGGGNAIGPSEQAQTQGGERVYGYDLMTQQERKEYQDRMRAAKTNQEREALRLEHHKQMEARAKAQGKTLHDVQPTGRGPGQAPSGGRGY